jgi:hypothetical protein
MVQSIPRTVSPAGYSPHTSRIIVQPSVNYQTPNIMQRRVIVPNIENIQQFPLNGQINFHKPSSPQINNQIPLQNQIIIH